MPKVELLDNTPYRTLAEHAEVQEWRNAFAMVQMRCRDLQKMVFEQAAAIKAMRLELTSLQQVLTSGPSYVAGHYDEGDLQERESEDDSEN